MVGKLETGTYMEVLNILPLVYGHTMHGTLHFSSDSIAPTTIICKSASLIKTIIMHHEISMQFTLFFDKSRCMLLITVITRDARDLWQRKQTLSLSFALRLVRVLS